MPPVVAAVAAVLVEVGVGAATASIIATIAVDLVISVGLSYVSQAISGRPKSSAQEQAGIQGTLQAGDNRARSFGIGKFCTAGSLVYANSWTAISSKPNEFLTMVIALSDLPMAGLDRIFVGDSVGTYSAGGHTTPLIPGYSISEFEKGGEYNLWVKFYDGTQSAADPALHALFGADPTYPWDTNAIGTGMAYAIVTARFNSGIFSGFPQLRFEGRGSLWYDPRSDSSVGGSGSQRFATPSTWALSSNPAVIIYNVLRGVSYNGQWLYGLQTMNASRLPLDNWVAAMNVCDATVDDLGGALEFSYRCGAEVLVSTTPADLIDELLKACNGRLLEIGGIYKLNVGAAPASGLSFDDSALLISQPSNLSPFPSLSETVNGITAKYPEPSESWNTKDAPPLFSATLEAEDGGRRLTADVSYGAVPYASQVQRLMASAVLEARKFRHHTIMLPPLFWILEPGDVASWTSAKNGYSSKTFRIDAITDNDNLDVGMQFSECDPADYDFDPVTGYTTPVSAPVQTVFPPINVPPNALATLLEATANLKNVQRLLDQYAEIGIGQVYKTEVVLPGLVAGVLASVTREITLRADGDSALARLVEEARAIANDATASALIKWVAAAGPAGVVARLALVSRATLGDAFTEAGIYIDAMIIGGDLVSQITLDADFIWLKANAGRVLLSDGGVTTEFLALGAATNHNTLEYVGPTTGSAAPASFTTLDSISFLSEGSPVCFSGAINFKNGDNTDHGASWRLTRDGTQIWPPSGMEDVTVLANMTWGIPIVWAETPGAGTYTYAIQWKSAHVNNQAFGVFINIDEIKR